MRNVDKLSSAASLFARVLGSGYDVEMMTTTIISSCKSNMFSFVKTDGVYVMASVAWDVGHIPDNMRRESIGKTCENLSKIFEKGGFTSLGVTHTNDDGSKRKAHAYLIIEDARLQYFTERAARPPSLVSRFRIVVRNAIKRMVPDPINQY